MLNVVCLQGRLAKDPQMRRTADGTELVIMRVAVQHGQLADGKERCSFLEVTAWRGLAKFVCDYFRKGQMIIIHGHLQQRMWVDTDGKNMSSTSIIADDIYFAGKRREDEAEKRTEQAGDIEDEQLPF